MGIDIMKLMGIFNPNILCYKLTRYIKQSQNYNKDLMNNYPLKQITREIWEKKVNSTSMYTIPAQDEAFPVLQQLNQILSRLITLPLTQTLDESLVEYFFTGVFPTVCLKIIRSKYFKNPQVLKYSNFVLQKSVLLVATYLEYAKKFPRFLQILLHVFSDEYYFKNNNQMHYMIYPYSYFPTIQKNIEYKEEDFVDVLKVGNLYEKVTWSQGIIVEVTQNQLEIQYLYDSNDKKIKFKKDSPQIAPYKTKSHIFQWRMGLKKGDYVDVQDSFGSWYNGTIVDIIDKADGKKDIKVSLKIYHQSGNKEDQHGQYFGFADYEEILDFTSPKLAPFCTVAKQYCYQSSKASCFDSVQDLNDYEFKEINGSRIYALPRRKNLSLFQFQTINQFGRLGGFQNYLNYLQNQINFDVLCFYVKGISGVSAYLHRQIVVNLVQRIKRLFQKYLFNNNEKTTKLFTKEQSQMAFSGLRALQKRIYSNQSVSRYENKIKMSLADICLQSQAIKNKLLGLNQLKDIVRSVTHISQKNKYIKQWVKSNKIFQKIYITNSHVQLIKKSEQFFKYLINENILEVTDLQKLYKLAQKGDFESRVSLYKLFQQVSHIFKKEHVQFLIDTILESQLSLILNQDIDLLHELSRFSNYFPLEKVIKFFQNIILGQNKVKQLNDYAIKKYSQIVVKNQDVKPHRRNIIKNFIQKLSTHDISQVTKVLKGIFQGIGIGDWGKKDLNQILVEEKVDQVVVQTLVKFKDQPQFSKYFTILLDFLLSIYKMSHKIKINIMTLMNIWSLLQDKQEKQKQFFKWANQISKCQQGLEGANIQEIENFYNKIFTPESIPQMQGSQFELAKNLFVQVNKRLRYITVSSAFKDREIQKEYKRKVQMKNLRLIQAIIKMIYYIKSEPINNQVLLFFMELYTSKDNSQQQIDLFLNKLLVDFKEQYQSKDYKMLIQTIKLIEVVINDSQKNVETNINSLVSKKQSEMAKFIIMNQVTYVSIDSHKKSQLILPMNTTIIKLRKTLAKQFSLTWQQVKIVSSREVEDYQNSKTLKEVKLNPNQPLTISRRVIGSQTEQQLIINDEMNPKAIRCFKAIFDKYSTNGKMDKNQCNGFTTVCLGSSCSAKYYNEKISGLYNKYDDDNDGFLTFQNFLKFYEDAAKDRPPTVWSNLRSFGVKGDFKFNWEPEELIQVTKYPRNIIAEYPNVYEILFDLLHVKQVASGAFELLQRLPVSRAIQQQLLNIQNQEDLQKILLTPDLYQLSYKLNIIQYLAHSTQLRTETQKKWHFKFIELQGYQLLYNSLQRIIGKQNESNEEQKQIKMQICETSLNLLNQYWLQCFSVDPKNTRLSLAFIASDEDIDEKMQYLILGRFFKSQKKIQAKPSKLPFNTSSYSWKGVQKQKILKFLIDQFERKWNQISNIGKNTENNQLRYNLTTLIIKFIDALNILNLMQSPEHLINIMNNLFNKIPSLELIRRFYCLILSQNFFTTENKYQGAFIKQLFRNLTKPTITSEHFRVLAVLVSRFGIQSSQNDEQESKSTTKKLKQVLFDNVLNNTSQLTVQGCAKLLINFNLQQTPYEIFQKIWDQRLFNPKTVDQKQQSKVALYQLILKIVDSNPEIINKIIEKVLNTIQKQIKNIKITYCSEFKQRSSTGYAGLKNLGSTCYINSMVQQLYMNKNFRYCLLRANDQQQPNYVQVVDNKNEPRIVDDNFLHQIQRIFANLQLTNRIEFAPKDFCIAYKPFGESVNVLIQQDVQQFVSMFFDRLEASLSKTIFRKLVSDFYLGKTTNLFKCHACQQVKKVEQTFHSISLQVKTSKTLAQSFNRFTHGQMISDYRCQFCNNKVDVTKMTRISLAPKILIIHLQRIIFNYDTFINEKITTKHSFPNSFNLYQSTLDCYQGTTGQGMQPLPEYNYNLIGIICHSGTAQSGHYISYIKTSENKWIQFNDSQVTTFNPSNIESQCFGGYFSAGSFDDDYYQQKKQSSKSAYVLLYEKVGQNTIQLVLNKEFQKCKNEKQKEKLKEKILSALELEQVITKIKDQQKNNQSQQQLMKLSESQRNQTSATPKQNQSHQQSSSAPEDSQKQANKLLEQKQIQIKRHQSQDNIQTNIQVSKQKQTQNKNEELPQPKVQKEQVVYIKDPVSPYIPQKFQKQILIDNEIHFFQKCMSSSNFAKFFSQLISKPNSLYSSILPLCKKLTFGFWLKSPSFKDLLQMLDGILKVYPQGFENIVTQNPAIITLLIESPDTDIRTAMANFLSKTIADTIQTKKINIRQNNDDPIFQFLDKLFSLLPSTVSRCWTKFGQYFQFWYELSTKGQVLVQYMIDRQIIKHFMDYFLDSKSPLKIYVTKRQHPIGSTYANPNFSMLLKCVFSLLQQRMILNAKSNDPKKHITSSPDEQKLLMSFESLQKLISESYQNIAAQLVKEICPRNLAASQKAAIVILKGVSKSNSETVQPYLQVLHEFALIDDQYQDLRIKWIIGKQTLAVTSQNLKLVAMNNYSLDQKLYCYDSSLNIQGGSSLLQPILTYHRRIETFALLCTRQVLKLCDVSPKIRKYINSLQSPTLVYAKFTDFLKSFVDKYFQDHKKSLGFYSSSVGFNRQQFSKQVKQLYEKVQKKMMQDQLNSKKQKQDQTKERKKQQKQNEKNKQNANKQKVEQSETRENQKDLNSQKKEVVQVQKPNNEKLIQFEQVVNKEEAGPKSDWLTNEEQFPRAVDVQMKEQYEERAPGYDQLKQQQVQTQDKQNEQRKPASGQLQQKQTTDFSKYGQNKEELSQSKKKQKQEGEEKVQQIEMKQINQQHGNKNLSINVNKGNQLTQYIDDQDDDWAYNDIAMQTKQSKQEQKYNYSAYNDDYVARQESKDYIITVNQAKDSESKNKSQYTTLNYSDQDEEEPLMKSKEQNSAAAQKEVVKDYKQVWHPVKFNYIPKSTIPLQDKFSSITIEEHESQVVYVLTKPTGITNRSFSSMGATQKNFDRILEQTWKNQKVKSVHGFYIKNNSRDSIRIQTDDGCVFCKAGENLIVWCDKILKVWESQKHFDWPKWRIYTSNTH